MGLLEFTGLVATLLVFLSFLSSNVKFIRWVNLAGSVLFVIYGFGIGAIWTGVLNFGLIFVHIYHLLKIYRGGNNARKNK